MFAHWMNFKQLSSWNIDKICRTALCKSFMQSYSHEAVYPQRNKFSNKLGFVHLKATRRKCSIIFCLLYWYAHWNTFSFSFPFCWRHCILYIESVPNAGSGQVARVMMKTKQREQKQLQQIFLLNHTVGEEFISSLPWQDPSPWPLSWSFGLPITAGKWTR